MATPASAGTECAFEENRAYLMRLAYRMLGSLSDAEDVVQEAWVRWRGAAGQEIASPRAYLRKVATRLCLDHLKSARVRRELYVGPWLPEPVAGEPEGSDPIIGEDIMMSLMIALERLTPAQRAAFLLHDIFDAPFAEVAEILGKPEATCRQLAVRARRQVRDARRRFQVDRAEAERLTDAFLKAAREGDAEALKRLLAENVVVYTDGGGVRAAALNVLEGKERALRLVLGLRRKVGEALPPILYRGSINAAPGVITLEPDGLPQATSIEVAGGRIAGIYIVRNPEKLRLLPAGMPDGGANRAR